MSEIIPLNSELEQRNNEIIVFEIIDWSYILEYQAA